MKKRLPLFLLVAVLLGVAATLRAPRPAGAFDTVAFGQLPTLANGRFKPLDTLARSTLLMLQGRQTVRTAEGRAYAPSEWLLDVFFRPAIADGYAVFEIVHPDVLALLNLTPEIGAGKKRFTYLQLRPGLRELDRQAKLAEGVEAPQRTPFQRAVFQLRNNLITYQRLQASFLPPDDDAFLADVLALEKTLSSSARADELRRTFTALETWSLLLPIPPTNNSREPHAWKNFGAALQLSFANGPLDPSVLAYLRLGAAWRAQDVTAFNVEVRAYRQTLATRFPSELRKCWIETHFNAAQPFYTSMLIYVAAFLAAIFSWLRWPQALARVAFGLVGIGFVLTTAGIAARMWLEGRPPVTNLYSSALFVGWAAVALCLLLERSFKNALGSSAAGLIGFATLLIAHHLAVGGDTLEMMRAVLDSNFWLATHVVMITVGYSATFLAGALALIYVLRGTFTRSLDRATADALARMVYGTVCFATLFSFVGTVLGGIWADQSWGRFWGWDPKENGALIIVLWNALILHVRWGGFIRTRGLMALAIFGNVVTAWSWFGVNMLGVGLHSYGFMDAAFWWLIGFAASQLAAMALCARAEKGLV